MALIFMIVRNNTLPTVGCRAVRLALPDTL